MRVRPAIQTFSITLIATSVATAAPPFFETWQSFGIDDGLPSEKTFCVLTTETDVWAGTDQGLARLHGGQWQAITESDGLAHDAVLCLAEDPDTGDIWIGTMGGVTRFSAGRFDTFTQLDSGLANDVVYGLAAHEGEIWVATAAGASRFQIAEDRWSIFTEQNAPMHEIWCYSVAPGPNRIYLAVWGGGLLEFDIERAHWKHYRDPDGEMEIDLFRDDGLIHDVVASVTCDERDRVWIATYFGLSSYDGRKWRNFMDHDSPLLSNFVNFVKARGPYCWIGTDKGLNASDRENWWTYRRDPNTGEGIVIWQPANESPQRFTTPTAMPHNYVLGISFRGDEIWLATEKGPVRGTVSPPATVRADATELKCEPRPAVTGLEKEPLANDSRAIDNTEGAKE